MRLLSIFVFVMLFIFIIGCTPKTVKFAQDQKLIVTRPTPEEVAAPAEKIDYKIFAVRAFQFGYDPDLIEVDLGDHVMLTVTSVDVGHGFALPDFGINERIPAEESVTFRFVADKAGEFEFFNPAYSGKGWKDMKGKFIVKRTEEAEP